MYTVVIKTCVQIVLALLIADAFGAVGHWAEDNYLPYDTRIPVLSDIAKANELHHFAPQTITEGSYLETCKVMIVLTASFLFVCRCVFGITFASAPAFYTTTALVGPIINLIHRWQHEPEERRPRLVAFLQRKHVLVPPYVHRQHHTDTLSHRDYNLILYPMNVVYNDMGLWSALERAVEAITGAVPCRKRGVNSYVERFDHESDSDYETRLKDMYERGLLECLSIPRV